MTYTPAYRIKLWIHPLYSTNFCPFFYITHCNLLMRLNVCNRVVSCEFWWQTTSDCIWHSNNAHDCIVQCVCEWNWNPEVTIRLHMTYSDDNTGSSGIRREHQYSINVPYVATLSLCRFVNALLSYCFLAAYAIPSRFNCNSVCRPDQ